MTDLAVRAAAQGPDPSVEALLATWLPTRRWYPGRGEVRAEPWLAVTFDPGDDGETTTGPDGETLEATSADVVLLLTRLEGDALPGGAVTVQVPLVLSDPAAPGPGYIDTVATSSGDVAVHDGGAHPVCWLTLARAMGIEGPATTLTDRGRVLAGEQSNTSVILPGVPSAGGAGGMLKILRTVADGPHPDVVVPQALTEDGWDGVPRFLGALEIETGDADGAVPVPVHLAIMSELVPHAVDGFELACDLASRGESFTAHATALGRLVAELHERMARVLPTGPPLDAAAFVAGLRGRAARAVADAPSLADHTGEIASLLDALEERLGALAEPVPTQRIHGDLHLGQTLFGDGAWKVLDFEGEPQRPVAERTRPDLPWRDVAGMLRSFDYAAAVGAAPDPATWQAEATGAFLTGYRSGRVPPSGMTDDTAELVLRALVLDKALYEVVYETHHRPHWLPIPLGAVDRVFTRPV
ncbi:maltokinase [Isoptericola sp. CG 20/1183]|uniref:Maltokinase n=1 Tax=Isoptericola halotolerans TaxID=300560 RepID=A0ABX5EE65_9MICO|nr:MULTISPECIES: phosphotransferase [Isoptericola]PRZ04819.1 maltokinase [Isoptericola halotolerans]PRZ05310.1 maltokinase [Isoptericola sp. CG 20/1183]